MMKQSAEAKTEFPVIEPSTGEVVGSFPVTPDAEVDRAVERAAAAQDRWSWASVDERARLLRALAEGLREQKSELAELMTREMGKRTAEGEGEAEKCAWVCDHYAVHGPAMLQPEPIDSDAVKSYVAFRPLGTLLAIMPWNFPLWQVFRFVAPALLAGNSVLLKHAPNVPGCSRAIEDLVRAACEEAGCDGDLFHSLLVGEDRVPRLIEDRRVRGVTLTGSTRAGRAVAELAGRSLKKTVLELGGSDPYVVLADADVEHAAEVCVTSRMINGGQSCIAAKRFIVLEPVADAFTEAVHERMAKLTWGDPRDPEVDVGPMARKDLRDALHEQVRSSVEAGARLRLGGEIPPGNGFYYPPTLLADVRPGMAAFDQELFGPAAALIVAHDEDEAADLANGGDYGLGAAVFSRDEVKAEAWARDRLEAGCCFVNDFVRSDPRLPFGGVKDSGYGRELSLLGLREWVNAKTVWIR